ncbi:MAG TPA: hypothetical protein VKM54_20310 [Myxococcota bacterium]|nr:hypothetical protein [Myxococcota bacterium]
MSSTPTAAKHDGNTVLDREPREADALLPDELALFTLALEDLPPAAGKDEHGLAGLEQALAVLARAAHRTNAA